MYFFARHPGVMGRRDGCAIVVNSRYSVVMPQHAKTPLFASLVSDRRVAMMLGLGFSSGLPFLLVYGTQTAWFSEAKVPIETIGLLTELTLAYKFKFLWAPFLDRHTPPLLGHWLGRRRAWIVVAQVAVMIALAGVAFGDPAHWLVWTIVFSTALGFAGATQDVVIDGWRIAAAPEKQPVMNAWGEIGWRMGNLAAGAGALYLSDRVGWRGAYLVMALLMLPGLVCALLAPEPESDKRAHDVPKPNSNLIKTIWTPIKELVGRLGALAIPVLLLVALFRMPGYVSTAMALPLFKSLHYTNSDIATVTKLFGFWVAIGATILGGWLVPRIGMMPSLLIGTIAGSASHLALAWLAARGEGGGFWAFAIAVSIDSFAYAFASYVLITYMSTLASADFAASQFALMTSLVAFPGSVLAGGSGFMVKALGFTNFFIATSLIGIPVALLCLWVWRQHARVGAGGFAEASG